MADYREVPGFDLVVVDGGRAGEFSQGAFASLVACSRR